MIYGGKKKKVFHYVFIFFQDSTGCLIWSEELLLANGCVKNNIKNSVWSLWCHSRQTLLLPSTLRCSVILSTRSIYERDYRRPGQPPDTRWPWQKIQFDFSKGVEGIKKHIGLLKDEFVQRWIGPEGRPLIDHMLEQTRVQWEFLGLESLNQWVVSSDQEIGGRSEAYVKLSKNNTSCLLYGTLCSTPPRDGETRYSGYCTLRSKQPLVSAKIQTYFLLSSMFKTVVLLSIFVKTLIFQDSLFLINIIFKRTLFIWIRNLCNTINALSLLINLMHPCNNIL